MPKPSPGTPAAPPTFEAAITRLEAIVEEMDSKNIALQDLIVRYEEGVQLAKICEERLKEAERRVEIITRDAAGKPQLAEFEPETKPAPREDVSLF